MSSFPAFHLGLGRAYGSLDHFLFIIHLLLFDFLLLFYYFISSFTHLQSNKLGTQLHMYI